MPDRMPTDPGPRTQPKKFYELFQEVARGAYRAGRYRGEFQPDNLSKIEKRTIDRNLRLWWKQNVGEIPDHE